MKNIRLISRDVKIFKTMLLLISFLMAPKNAYATSYPAVLPSIFIGLFIVVISRVCVRLWKERFAKDKNISLEMAFRDNLVLYSMIVPFYYLLNVWQEITRWSILGPSVIFTDDWVERAATITPYMVTIYAALFLFYIFDLCLSEKTFPNLDVIQHSITKSFFPFFVTICTFIAVALPQLF